MLNSNRLQIQLMVFEGESYSDTLMYSRIFKLLIIFIYFELLIKSRRKLSFFLPCKMPDPAYVATGVYIVQM